MIEVGNVYYFIELLIPVIVISVTYHLLKNKTLNFQYTYLFIWCLLGFILHFAKQLVYQDISQLSKSTAENICAVSTLVFPFIMMIKKKNVLHDFMFLIGLVGGGAGLLYPTEALGESLFTFETIRFYFCHMSLLAIPLLLALLNIREPDLKNGGLCRFYFWRTKQSSCLIPRFLRLQALRQERVLRPYNYLLTVNI